MGSEVSIQLKMRRSFRVEEFCKTANCPSSETLLRYRRHRIPIAERAAINIHLRDCDFCSAELQLLTRHRSFSEEDRVAEMPGQLRRLAEDFLNGSRTSFTRIDFGANRHSH